MSHFQITKRTLHSTSATTSSVDKLFRSLGLFQNKINYGVFDGTKFGGGGEEVSVMNPSTNEQLATVRFGNASDYERCVEATNDAKLIWARTPAPVRGEVIRKLGNNLRKKKSELGALITLEIGKITAEGEGEVQEFIDVCDMAAGMARQIGGNGSMFPSERKQHTIIETWNPLKGIVGIIPAFNFPHAVFGWNAAISLVCGNAQLVKGAESASLVTIATQKILMDTLKECGVNPAIATLCQGRGNLIGELMTNDKRLELISFTGSVATGRRVSANVGNRFGRALLELGGNNAIIVMNDANLEMALRSVLFAAVGTCGQRCTSLRRLLLHEDIYDEFLLRLKLAYAKINIGDPFASGGGSAVLCGPLHSKQAVDVYNKTLAEALGESGNKKVEIIYNSPLPTKGNFVYPTIIEVASPHAKIIKEERFVPILYVQKVKSLEQAIEMNNSVPQGLTSAIFTNDMKKVFTWIGPDGSDCGIANVNTSCSGAEIGSAFGGNKETGGGRESGSDSWKQYMRRGTCTINYGNDVPLAQGIDFS